MNIKVIDNHKIKLADELNSAIEKSSRIRIAVAFAKYSGFRLVKDAFYSFLANGGRATLLIGLDFHTTDPEVLREFINVSESNNLFELYCLRGNLQQTATYHPKLYLFNQEHGNTTSIVGSSNLTRGGLIDNVEINLEISSPNSDEVYSDLSNAFLQIEVAKRRIKPNIDYVNDYEELFRLAKKDKNISDHPKYKEMQKLEEELPTPKISNSDLVGWMKLVYDYLPEGQFATNEIYKYEDVFKQKYPENQYIQAKIRQQLQFLEKLGLLRKPSRNHWIKT